MKNNCENCIHYEPINEVRGICQKSFQFSSIQEALEEDSKDVEGIGSVGLGIVDYSFTCKFHAINAEKECHHF